MFERFTQSSRKVITHAQEIARDLNHRSIDVEHLFASLAEGVDQIAADVLRERGVNAEEVQSILPPAQADRIMGHLPFTSDAKKVIELSLREALQLGHNYIGTEHLLLAIVRNESSDSRSGTELVVDSPLSELLYEHGLDMAATQQAVVKRLVGGKQAKKDKSDDDGVVGIPREILDGYLEWIEEIDSVFGPLASDHPAMEVAAKFRGMRK